MRFWNCHCALGSGKVLSFVLSLFCKVWKVWVVCQRVLVKKFLIIFEVEHIHLKLICVCSRLYEVEHIPHQNICASKISVYWCVWRGKPIHFVRLNKMYFHSIKIFGKLLDGYILAEFFDYETYSFGILNIYWWFFNITNTYIV